jgi:hypothetical protein
MRTTVDLSRDLLETAMKFTHARTKTAMIEMGLRELIRQSKIEGLRKLRGKLDLDVDLEKSRKR